MEWVGGNQGEKEVTDVLFSITFLLFSNLKHVVVVVFRYLCCPICGVCLIKQQTNNNNIHKKNKKNKKNKKKTKKMFCCSVC